MSRTADPDDPRPAVLHIGMMKTGTSFVQDVLVRNSARLAAQRIHYPMDHTRWGLQVRAARDVLNLDGPRSAEGAWAELTRQAAEHRESRVLVSMEFLSFATSEQARRIVADLYPRPVRVVITVRDLARVLPSAWQSMMKQGHPWAFVDFVHAVLAPRGAGGEAARRFWRHHDLEQILGTWVSAVDRSEVHIVTVPPSGAEPHVLWERFVTACSIADDGFDIHQGRGSNFSLTYSETEFLREVNLAIGDRLSKLARKRWAARYLANRLLRANDGDSTAHDRPELDEAGIAWATQKSRHWVRSIESSGVHVHGTLDDLMVKRTPGPDIGPAYRFPGNSAQIVAELMVRLAQIDPEMPDELLSGHSAVLSQAGPEQGADEAVRAVIEPVGAKRSRM